jgi:hypothetical protein
VYTRGMLGYRPPDTAAGAALGDAPVHRLSVGSHGRGGLCGAEHVATVKTGVHCYRGCCLTLVDGRARMAEHLLEALFACQSAAQPP